MSLFDKFLDEIYEMTEEEEKQQSCFSELLRSSG